MLTNLATRIYDTPLLIHPDKFATIMAVLGPRLGEPEGASLVKGLLAEPLPTPQCRSLEAGSIALAAPPWAQAPARLAIVPVFGSLVHRTGGVDAMSGLRSYESLRADYRQAASDPAVDAVVLEFASNGGELHGLFDLVDEIANGAKPTYAIVNETAYSAAYALASACDRIYLTRTAGVGSIGVIARHVDTSAKDATNGLSYTTVYFGDRKNDFSSDGPLSEEARATLVGSLGRAYDLFVTTVARNRGISAETVAATQAGTYEGQSAVEAGLADAVLSFDQAITVIAKKTQSTGGIRMQKTGLQHQLEALCKGASDQEIVEAMAALDYLPRELAISEEAKAAYGAEQYALGRAQAMAHAKELAALCDLGQTPALLSGLITSEVDLEAAREQILKAQSEGQAQIRSTVTAAMEDENPLLADAKRRAARA